MSLSFKESGLQLPKSALIIEDDQAIRSLLADILQDEKFEIQEASNGREGLDVLLKWHPRMIFVDLYMPVMGGLQFRIEQLKQPKIASIPTISMSAGAGYRSLHFDGHIPKPFDINTVIFTAESFLNAIKVPKR